MTCLRSRSWDSKPGGLGWGNHQERTLTLRRKDASIADTATGDFKHCYIVELDCEPSSSPENLRIGAKRGKHLD